MTVYTFDDFARATFDGARTLQGGALSAEQMAAAIAYLKAPGSGSDASTSFAAYVEQKLQDNPPVLPTGVSYVACLGIGDSHITNYQSATTYVRDVGGTAGIIADTLWGLFIEHQRLYPEQHPELGRMADGLRRFMHGQGTRAFNNRYAAALQDIMWSAGGPPFSAYAFAAHYGARG